ncbi:MAG TPA: glycosyl transferase family 1 [Cyanobacteria bacterium UBA12227]|nr:glycosyl transferase family 1 [Cyanobacteria bacterium UBA12227]HAX87758.1 glycosyl transferase family 1 [Cyanobacteria bacterium UBA11370]
MSYKPLRITFLITSLEYGGRQTQLIRIGTKLKRLGWTIEVVSMCSPQAFTEELKDRGIPVFSLNMQRGVPDFRAIWKLAKILNQSQPHILHSHLVHANLLARITRLLVRVPVLISTAGNINEGGRWREIAYRLTDPLCDLTTNVSKAATEWYVQVGAVPAHKITFIPNSIEPEHFFSNPQWREFIRDELELKGKFVWLAIGRLEEQKDYPTMLRAFAQISRQLPQTLLLVVGKGSLQNNLEALTKELGLHEKVRFLGIRNDIAKIMNAADAYVMSSAWEGMPGVLLEASAVGLPIVATDVGGNREVVLDGKSGFLVPSQNSQALAEAMQQLITLSDSERQQIGKVGRNYVIANYSLTEGVKRWENLYRELVRRYQITL